MLLLEHELGNTDKETINSVHVAELCAKDWGLWRTTTMNLDKVQQLANHYTQLTDENKARVSATGGRPLEAHRGGTEKHGLANTLPRR